MLPDQYQRKYQFDGIEQQTAEQVDVQIAIKEQGLVYDTVSIYITTSHEMKTYPL